MNLIDAVKSGKGFFRRGRRVEPIDPHMANTYFQFSASDVLADDWELEEIKVTISLNQFMSAWRRAYDAKYRVGHLLYGHQWALEPEKVAKELGLG